MWTAARPSYPSPSRGPAQRKSCSARRCERRRGSWGAVEGPSQQAAIESQARCRQTRRPELRAHRRKLRRRVALHPYDLSVTPLEASDVRLNYEVIGEGTPVTLLHGFTQSKRSWHEIIEQMPDGWKWVVPDLRGHGDTEVRPGAPHTMDASRDDLVMLWD